MAVWVAVTAEEQAAGMEVAAKAVAAMGAAQEVEEGALMGV